MNRLQSLYRNARKLMGYVAIGLVGVLSLSGMATAEETIVITKQARAHITQSTEALSRASQAINKQSADKKVKRLVMAYEKNKATMTKAQEIAAQEEIIGATAVSLKAKAQALKAYSLRIDSAIRSYQDALATAGPDEGTRDMTKGSGKGWIVGHIKELQAIAGLLPIGDKGKRISEALRRKIEAILQVQRMQHKGQSGLTASTLEDLIETLIDAKSGVSEASLQLAAQAGHLVNLDRQKTIQKIVGAVRSIRIDVASFSKVWIENISPVLERYQELMFGAASPQTSIGSNKPSDFSDLLKQAQSGGAK